MRQTKCMINGCLFDYSFILYKQSNILSCCIRTPVPRRSLPLNYFNFLSISGDGWAVVSLAMLAKLGASSGFVMTFQYTGEAFPTVVRNTSVGSGSLCARIGSLLAPFIYLLVSNHYHTGVSSECRALRFPPPQ